MPNFHTDRIGCPKCGCTSSKVTDSRQAEIMGYVTTRRRRCCGECGHKFNVYEIDEERVEKIIKLQTDISIRVESAARLGMIDREIANRILKGQPQ